MPGFLDFSAEGYLNSLFRLFGKPNLSAGKPIIGLFGLPALAKHLAENAVFVTDGIAHGGLADGGKSVKEAGGKPPQASVAKTCVRLLLVDFFRGNSQGGKRRFKSVLYAEIVKVVAQGTSHQKLH